MVTEASGDIWERLVRLAEDVPSFGLRQLGRKIVLTRQTDLVEDLGLVGDDAVEFMDAYASAFDVEAGDYKFSSYFGSERLWLLPGFSKAVRKNSITLGMLELAARTGTWDSLRLEQARASGVYEIEAR
jgi:hypothetical protein